MGSFFKKNLKEIDLENSYLQMVEENKNQFYKIAYSYVHSEDDALEVIQESVYKGYLGLSTVKERKYLKTWFTRILIRVAIDMQRQKKRVFVNEEMALKEKQIFTLEKDSDMKMDMERALNSLNEDERTIIVLKYFEDKKFDEISEILEKPVGTVKTLLYRALKKLKVNFEEVATYE